MITLINHPGLKTVSGIQIQTPSPSIGLAYIGAYLKKHGFDYQAIDACGEALDQILPYRHGGRQVMVQGLTTAQVLERIPNGTRIVGLTCLFSHCWPLVLEIAAAVRERFPDALLVAGGEHPTAMPEQVLKSRLIDVVVEREGEETFLELVEHVYGEKSFHHIQGITYRDAQGHPIKNPPRKRIKDIDAIPYPDWDSWSINEYIDHHQVSGINLGRLMPILGSRGCPYECTFCSIPTMWTRRYIMRDPVALVDEMEFMKRKYDVTGFTFMDATFVVHRDKTLAFAQGLISRNLNITYQLPAGTRCEAFDEELADALDRSGLRNLALAPESGSEEILKVVRKQVKLPRLLQAAKVILKTRMTMGCFIVIGFPEDTPKTMRATLKLIRKLAWIGVHDVTVSKFTPYPGSEYFKQLVQNRVISDDMNELNNIIDFYSRNGVSYCPQISSRLLYWWMVRMFLNFYGISFLIRPWRVLKNFWAYFTKGTENARYMRFFTEIFFLRQKWHRLKPETNSTR